jgi:uncharacterized delta-60 repeat protein
MKRIIKNQFTSHCFLTFILLVFCFQNQAFAQNPGSLDNAFGTGGTTYTLAPRIPASNSAFLLNKATIQSDGKLLGLFNAHDNSDLTYTNTIVRYNQDGSLDMSFGNSGLLYMNWNTPTNVYGNAYALTTQIVNGTEKILVAGSYGGSGVLRIDRYNLDGSADLSFDNDGRAVFNTGYASAIAVQADGKILTIGDVGSLVRINDNGTLDTTFGSGGIVQTSVLSARALAVQTNGRIVIAGNSNSSMAVARFNSNGTLDDGGRKDLTPGDAFGTAGKTTFDFIASGGSSFMVGSANNLKVDGGDRIYVAGDASRKNSSARQFGVARFTANGLLDKTFDSDGKTTVALSSSDSVRSVLLQADGKVVLVGVTSFTSTGVGQDLGLARLISDGTPDAGFGTGGKVVKNLYGGNERSYNAMIQPDPVCGCEKITVLGSADDSSFFYSVTARFWE